ncbi:MAG: hypothetical protein KKH75_05590 [Actinobacteria bacterium]|nr:hypothetical protein [Actinomycetota bacterium]
MTQQSGRAIIAWVIAGMFVVAGVAVTTVGLTITTAFGWFAYQPLAAATFAPSGDTVFLSRTTVVGVVLLSLGLITLAFLIGWRAAIRRPR